jgi:phosphoglucosamine mutase
MGLEVAMQSMGGTLLRTSVGDRYVVESMRRNNYSFGGEQSGHLVFLDHITTGDGVLAGLQLLSVMRKQDRPLSELATVMESYPQVLKNVRTATRMNISEIPHFLTTQRKLEEKLDTTGRILVRPSGTEPVIRVMVEGQDETLINDMADELCELISNADRM